MENMLGTTLGTWEHIENLIGPIENSTGTCVKFFDCFLENLKTNGSLILIFISKNWN
jgi:hypothetical protein